MYPHTHTHTPSIPHTMLSASIRSPPQPPVTSSLAWVQAVEDLCIHRLGQNLYSKLTEECEAHIQTEIAKLVSMPDDANLLLQTVEVCYMCTHAHTHTRTHTHTHIIVCVCVCV